MPLVLRQWINGRSGFKSTLPFRVYSLDEPCPPISAGGVHGVGIHQAMLVTDDLAPVVDPAKPAYAIPSMAEIAAVRGTNGLKVVSTFSGCGGSCLGLEMAGFDVLYASEFVEAARETYALNHPGVILDGRDVREVTGEDVLRRLGLSVGELDLLEGSPPCSSFSTAGKRHKGWGQDHAYSDTSQRTDDLFFEFARLLEQMQPRAFVAENVSGLVKGSAKGYYKEIVLRLRECGYVVETALLDAQWLGVPQARQRLIFQGYRLDLDVKPTWPTPMPYRYSVRDALPWISALRLDTLGREQDHAGDLHGDDVEADPETGYRLMLDAHSISSEWDKLKEGASSDRYFNLVRPHRDAPAPTVTASNNRRGVAGITHPVKRRKFTLVELRRLCGFPDDFRLAGTYMQRWERLGRAVPPPMMAAVGREIARNLCAP